MAKSLNLVMPDIKILLPTILTRYLRSSSNLSSNLWIFFFSTWILLVSCADVSSSFSSSQEPREELRLRLQKAGTSSRQSFLSRCKKQSGQQYFPTWQRSERWVGREAPRCRPGTAGTVRRRRNEATAWGRCPPPAAAGSAGRRRAATDGPPRGPCFPSAAARRPEWVLENRKKKNHEDNDICLFIAAVKQRTGRRKEAKRTRFGFNLMKQQFFFSIDHHLPFKKAKLI